MKIKDPQLRMALKLQHSLEQGRTAPDRRLRDAVKETLSCARLLGRKLRSFVHAFDRGWLSAANQAEVQLIFQLHQLQGSVTQAVNQAHSISPLPRPTLRDLYDEIRQLDQEFSSFKLDLKAAGVISVETDPIELEGVHLGPFRINLNLATLSRKPDSRAFELEALEPNPAGGNDHVVHPHVQDGKACCGDATIPIASALHQGRLVDAFLALNSVLHTYNPSSPYISLGDWEGVRCSDCDDLVDSDYRYTCDSCGNTVCEDCSGSCDDCQRVCCKNCLERVEDEEPSYLCDRCRETCTNCRRFVASGDWEEGLCPGCLEERRQQSQTQQETTHEQQSAPIDSSPDSDTSTPVPAEPQTAPA